MYLPLRALTDDELRVHAQLLFDGAMGILGSGSVWLLTARDPRIPLADLRCASHLSFALGAFNSAEVRDCALRMARQAGKVGAKDAVRALCELARRARRGSYGAPPGITGSRDPVIPPSSTYIGDFP